MSKDLFEKPAKNKGSAPVCEKQVNVLLFAFGEGVEMASSLLDTLGITDYVRMEAVHKGCKLVISMVRGDQHPTDFFPLIKKAKIDVVVILGEDVLERYFRLLLEKVDQKNYPLKKVVTMGSKHKTPGIVKAKNEVMLLNILVNSDGYPANALGGGGGKNSDLAEAGNAPGRAP